MSAPWPDCPHNHADGDGALKRSCRVFVRGERGASATKFFFCVFALIVCIKFAVAGVSTQWITFGAFDGDGAALILGVFGATYGARRYTEVKRP